MPTTIKALAFRTVSATLLVLESKVSAGQGATDAAQAKPAPSTAQIAPAIAAGGHPLAVAAAQRGVLACSRRINQVASYLGLDDKAGAVLLLPPAQQDQRMASAAIEVQVTGVGSVYISTTFAPNQANGCGVNYEAVVYWPQRCDDVAKRSYAGLQAIGRIKTDIVVLDGGGPVRVFLMPVGPGCIAIKRETVL